MDFEIQRKGSEVREGESEGEGERLGEGGEWERGKISTSSFFLLPSSFFLLPSKKAYP
jgi:hypothetical protein